MEMLTTKKAALEEIIAIAKKNNIKPVSWFDFCGLVDDVWFNEKITWDQKELVNNWAWEVQKIKGAEYIFGAIVNAYNQNAIVW
jgi:hypothetical protein